MDYHFTRLQDHNMANDATVGTTPGDIDLYALGNNPAFTSNDYGDGEMSWTMNSEENMAIMNRFMARFE